MWFGQGTHFQQSWSVVLLNYTQATVNQVNMAKCSGIGPTGYDRSQLQFRSSEDLCMCAASLNHIHLCGPFVNARMVDCVVCQLALLRYKASSLSSCES